jgi:hypothetical protein
MSRRKQKSPPFVMLPHWVIKTPAWRALFPVDRAIYLELRGRFNGHNNGNIGLGCREAAGAVNVSKDTAHRSMSRLVEIGFIEATSKGFYKPLGRAATEWLLTELPDDRTGHRALKTFASWSPEKQNPRHSGETPRPSGETQTEKMKDITPLRRTTGTQTANSSKSASHHRDTSRATTSPAAATLSEVIDG